MRDAAAAPQGVTSQARFTAKILAKGFFHTRSLSMCILCLATGRLRFGALNLEKAKGRHGNRDVNRA